MNSVRGVTGIVKGAADGAAEGAGTRAARGATHGSHPSPSTVLPSGSTVTDPVAAAAEDEARKLAGRRQTRAATHPEAALAPGSGAPTPTPTVVRHSAPEELRAVADETFGSRDVRVATAGFSAPPDGTEYAARSDALLRGLTDGADRSRVGWVTSPSENKGIDGATQQVARETGTPTVLTTADEYVKYGDRRVMNQPWHVYPTPAEYSAATAHASSSLVVYGGRTQAVSDAVHAFQRGNRVAVVGDGSLTAAPRSDARIENAGEYLRHQIENVGTPNELAWVDGFTPEMARAMRDSPLVRRYNIDSTAGATDTGRAIGRFLAGQE